MIARATPCDRDLLRHVLRDGGDTIQQRQLEDHLTTCDLCRHELERLAGGDGWLSEVREHLSSSEVPRYQPDSVSSAPTHEFHPLDDEGDRQLDFLESSADPTKLGRLGLYEIESVIGRGGMGLVLKAFDPALNRHVAIKVLAAELATSGAARRRFARESQAAAAIAHEHVVAIHAVDNSGKLPFLVMPYIPGKSLQERLDESGPLDVKEILRISFQAAAGLAAAHAQGLVHRDIKPANILLENGIERVRITDFGLARAVDDASQTQSGFIAGTPQYMAPEQARGEPVDHRADLFSLGSVMYAMCTGRPPFRAETTLAVLRRICEESARPVREINPEVPDWLQAVITKLHARDPAQRFQSAAEVADLLERYLAHLQQPASCPAPAFQRFRPRWHSRWPRLEPRLAWLTTVCVVLVAVWIAYQVSVHGPRWNWSRDAVVTSVNSTSPSLPTDGNVRANTPAMTSGSGLIANGSPSHQPSRPPGFWESWDHDLAAVSAEIERFEKQSAKRLSPGPPRDDEQEIQAAAQQLEVLESQMK